MAPTWDVPVLFEFLRETENRKVLADFVTRASPGSREFLGK